MADLSKRLPHNVPGEFFVDDTCIDCDQCREVAPGVFRDAGGEATVHRQPDTAALRTSALQALLTCPVGSIGTLHRPELKAAIASFPLPVDENVFFCGYSSRNSFGASSYLIRREGGNVLMDSPRFTGPLVRRLEELGGVRWMILSHIDDIADHARFRRHFGCERVLHQREIRSGIADIEHQPTGDEPVSLDSELLLIPTPGHTRGHQVLLYRDRYLFSGDHLWYSPVRRRLAASRRHCWYSWPEQIESMERLRSRRFEWVLPGHGRRHHATAAGMQRSLTACIRWMKPVD